MADPDVKLKAAKNRTDDVVFETDGLKARFLQLQWGQDKVGESIICVQGAIDRSSVCQKEKREYMKRRADEEGCKMVAKLGTWMA